MLQLFHFPLDDVTKYAENNHSYEYWTHVDDYMYDIVYDIDGGFWAVDLATGESAGPIDYIGNGLPKVTYTYGESVYDPDCKHMTFTMHLGFEAPEFVMDPFVILYEFTPFDGDYYAIRADTVELAQSLNEPETSDCTDCVTQEQYDELYAMVEEQTRTIRSLEAEVESLAGLEETVTEVDQAMMDMATCMAAYVMDDEPEMTDAPEEPEETMPEMTEAETTEMPTMMPTASEPTEMPTMMPSKAPTMLFMAVPAMDGMVCSDDEDLRTFKNNNFESAEECADRCARDENGCAYFSYRMP